MTLLHDAPRPVPPPARHSHGDGALEELTEAVVVFLVSLAVYLTVAMLLDFKYLAFEGDAIARMANGFYVLHSRVPNIGAIGFVWNPLSSLLDLPLLSLNSLWPALASHDVAGTVMSAVAMAGATYQLHAILREWKVARVPRVVLTVLFVANPMIFLFGGNGMSEAIYLFAMVAAARYLLRWLRAGDPSSLVYCALALGLGYLERSEPIAAAALTTPLVFWVARTRSRAEPSRQFQSAPKAVATLLTPIVIAFVGWAVICWASSGTPFPEFTSKYGNTALISAAHYPATTTSARIAHELRAVTYFSPLLAIIIVVAVVVAIHRRNPQLLGVFSVLGGGLIFTLVSYAANATFPWYRYYIMVVPLEAVLVGSLFAAPFRLPRGAHAGTEEVTPTRRPPHQRTVGWLAAVGLSVVLLVPSLLGTAWGMDSRVMAPDIVYYYGFIYHDHLDQQDLRSQSAFSAIRTMADYLDARHYPNGDVIVDTADNCIPNVVTNVDNPRMFVIPNDPDFERELDQPLAYHARYLLVQGSGSAQADAVGQRYPDLGSARWASLIHTFPPRGFCVTFRLFRVTAEPPGGH
jgi:hypothetical protein